MTIDKVIYFVVLIEAVVLCTIVQITASTLWKK